MHTHRYMCGVDWWPRAKGRTRRLCGHSESQGALMHSQAECPLGSLGGTLMGLRKGLPGARDKLLGGQGLWRKAGRSVCPLQSVYQPCLLITSQV